MGESWGDGDGYEGKNGEGLHLGESVEQARVVDCRIDKKYVVEEDFRRTNIEEQGALQSESCAVYQ